MMQEYQKIFIHEKNQNQQNLRRKTKFQRVVKLKATVSGFHDIALKPHPI